MKDTYIRLASFILGMGHNFKKVFGHLLPLKYNGSRCPRGLYDSMGNVQVSKDFFVALYLQKAKLIRYFNSMHNRHHYKAINVGLTIKKSNSSTNVG